ncbi:hypothetical protein CgunFtcFv8_027763 [Champsocephalus gunnari]|uniref:Uncharacterized protein n=1 Tax=Champsocephalus gunnari TaxID=52237 RepID=A0AAN8I1Y5_CHAGU|nr:hypothetical protein CgunFtcFv8_027763 [Champsocephalus gunnari]
MKSQPPIRAFTVFPRQVSVLERSRDFATRLSLTFQTEGTPCPEEAAETPPAPRRLRRRPLPRGGCGDAPCPEEAAETPPAPRRLRRRPLPRGGCGDAPCPEGAAETPPAPRRLRRRPLPRGGCGDAPCPRRLRRRPLPRGGCGDAPCPEEAAETPPARGGCGDAPCPEARSPCVQGEVRGNTCFTNTTVIRLGLCIFGVLSPSLPPCLSTLQYNI